MFNMKTLVVRALLALSLAIGAAPLALAGPTYQVTIKELPGARFLDLQFLALGAAEPAFATISNLSGALAELQLDNATGNLADGYTIGNDGGFNGIFFELLSAGTIRFDVNFSNAAFGDGTTFSAALLDEFGANLGGLLPLVEIALMPGATDVLSIEESLVAVNAVPEPSDWLLVATGLFLIGAVRRRQQGR
ncbi:MAG: NF038129 family PEP-CTERM protein [Telluria sp.]